MGRREFITLLGTAATWPLAVQAATEIPVIGVLHTGTAGAFTKQIAAMRQTLKDSGRSRERILLSSFAGQMAAQTSSASISFFSSEAVFGPIK